MSSIEELCVKKPFNTIKIKQRPFIKRVIVVAILLLILIVVAFPLVWIILLAFKNNREIFLDTMSLPHRWNPSNLLEVLRQKGVYLAYRNTFIVALTALVGQILFAVMASYCLVRFKFKGRKAVFYSLLAGIALPGYVLMAPIMIISRQLGVYDTLQGLILPYMAFGVSYNILIFSGYLRNMPPDIEVAAIVDGCGFWQMFFKIVFPIMKPVIAVGCIFSFIGNYNEFGLASLILESTNLKTVTLLALTTSMSNYSQDYAIFAAAIIILMLPEVIVFLAFQRHIITNVVAGGVKG